ncbi:ATP phosphoribosyltransferase (ATP-PRTase) (ATP-PRT) [Phlyctochytrium planicorne]|nr:ATP phosphoribosyltransferase (ATP-PRTase) (ATP-PRT) [Phlyctochytrium planicorne]
MNAQDLNNRLLFGIPKKGRLHEQVMTLLKGADIQFHRKNRLDIALSTNHPIALVFLPAADIAQFVGAGNVDIGITGQDMVAEGEASVEELLQLGFGKCRLCIQVPNDSNYVSAKELVGKKIATSFEKLTKAHFDKIEAELRKEGQDPKPTIINYVSGSVEAACALGLADAIVDLVESGETMHAAKLHDIETLVSSQAVLICNPQKHRTNPLIEKVKRRIEGIIVAQRYVLFTYNIPRKMLNEAVKITPGKKAPTISPLESDDWVAVSVMVMKAQLVDIMDRLEDIGAQDILVTEIHNARMGSNAAYYNEAE